MPTVPFLGKTSFICPHCQAKAYTTPVIAWPHRPPNSPRALFHVDGFTCNGCAGLILNVTTAKGVQRVYPLEMRSLPSTQELRAEVPPSVLKDFTKAAITEQVCPDASAAMSRRALQTIIRDRFKAVVDGKRALFHEVEAVITSNQLPGYIADELHGLRSIANHGAHPTPGAEPEVIIEVDEAEASACLDVVSDLIEACYVTPLRARKRKEKREEKFGPDVS